MNPKLLLTTFCLAFFVILQAFPQPKKTMENYGIVIHGGAGGNDKTPLEPEIEKAYRKSLAEALNAGYDIIDRGGTALDAVETAVRIMEDADMFNAGKGAVFTSEGLNELDASIMDGKTLNAGAITMVTNIKNPISTARAVMEKSPHVMLAGKGAEEFAENMGFELVDPSYFYMEHRWQSYLKYKQQEEEQADSLEKGQIIEVDFNDKFGTVGAVAVDQRGNLAAATSTGGMTYKHAGRIGDSPIIGAATYANNNTCAVSATGHGEYFIRAVVAHDISALMEYKGMSIKEAADEVIMNKMEEMGGGGGVIAIDKDGNIAMPFNTAKMFRGFMRSNGEQDIQIF